MPQNCYIIQKFNFALVKNMFYLKNVEKQYIIDKLYKQIIFRSDSKW